MQHQIQTSRRRRQRGMGMAVTMLVLMGILTITLIGTVGIGGKRGYNGLLGLTDNALQSSAARTHSATAFNMAESGVQYTLAWLESLPQAPTGNAQAPTGWDFVTSAVGRGVVTPDPSNPGNTFAVRIYPDAYNAVGTQKKFLIEVVGTSGGATSIVQAYVEEGSLSKYLVLLNQWNDKNNYWVSGLNEFDGPVHDNNSNGIPESVAWKSAAGTSPMFTYNGPDAYTVSSPTGINWVKDFSSYAAPQIVTNPNGTQTNQWLNVASGGAGSVHTGTPVVPFPTSSNIQKSAALGNAAVTNPVGVTLCPGGGVYVEGNVSEMALSATGTNNTAQVMTITQPTQLGTLVQRVTIDPNSGTTTLETQQTNGTWLITGALAGTGNGVVYVNGNIGTPTGNPNPQTSVLTSPKTGGLHGVVADNAVSTGGIVTHNNGLNIVTPQNDSTNLDGSVTYNTQRQITKDANGNPEYTDVNGNPTSNPANGIPVYAPESTDSNFTAKAGTLGIVTNNAWVNVKDYTGAALNKFEMDGTVLASGIYDADNYNGRPPGLWENMGGYLSSTVGYFGSFNNNLTIASGFNVQFSYDARMQYASPPYFPASNLSYSVISWHQVSQPLEP